MLSQIEASTKTSTQLNTILDQLKQATAEKNRNTIARLSSELVGQANLLSATLLETVIRTGETSAVEPGAGAGAGTGKTTTPSLEDTLALLEARKQATFLLIKCFAYGDSIKNPPP